MNQSLGFRIRVDAPQPRLWVCLCAALVFLEGSLVCGGERDTHPTLGIQSRAPQFHAITGLEIISGPGKRIPNGTILLRDDVIVAVREGRHVPPGAREWDRSGKTAYPGFIDAYGEGTAERDRSTESLHWNRHIRPGRRVAEPVGNDNDLNEKFRRAGILLRLVAPSDGIIKGQSALVSTGSSELPRRLVAEDVATHLRLTIPHSRDRDYYPNSPMGAVALARQAMLDARWYRDAWNAFRNQAGLPSPELNRSLALLSQFIDEGKRFIAEASNEQMFLRADRFAREFSLPLIIFGSGREYRRLESIRATGRAVIVPLDFPKPPDVSTRETAAQTSLSSLMHWDLAPENPGRLDAAGIPIALTSHGLKDRSEFLKRVRKSVERGLGEEAALAALTIRPAELLGVSAKYGTLQAGKIANLLIAEGDLFQRDGVISEVWISGRRDSFVNESSFDLEGEWKLELGREAWVPEMRLRFTREKEKLKGSLSFEERAEEDQPSESRTQIKLETVEYRAGRLRAKVSARLLKEVEQKEWLRVSATFLGGEIDVLRGEIARPDGDSIDFIARRVEVSDDSGREAAASKELVGAESELNLIPINYPFGAFGWETPPSSPDPVLIENARIWTCGPLGVIERGAILVKNGKLAAIGRDLEAPDGVTRIDAAGRHLTPGIIDCHSHMATDGGVNESAQAITAEVRIGDFIDANDINIYRQLAGGVTAANILHGSANPIGGQNQVIKLRWGLTYEGLRFEEAPGGIKFALGENVKQSNRGNDYTTRYPQTRMGVEQLMRDAFLSARDYGKRWARWESHHDGLPPRRDLELEAIGEILEGRRCVHCHSYRQDEILALIRTLDEFGIQIGTFQHILEGYKVAPEMKRHGAMASGFSDWWAYKMEVFDAIPYNGALMHQAGIVVSFNSDDRELARHLNQEAAKAVRYGGVSEEEALKFVTLNPAKQLRVDSLVGSLEVGKQADFVIWSGHPLSNFTRCEETWIDGVCYFSLERDKALRIQADEMRQTLVAKILASGQEMEKQGEGKVDEAALWPRDDLFCFPHDDDQHGWEAHDEY